MIAVRIPASLLLAPPGHTRGRWIRACVRTALRRGIQPEPDSAPKRLAQPRLCALAWSPALALAVDAAADAAGITRSAWLRRALASWGEAMMGVDDDFS